MKEEIIKILNDIRPGENYEECNTLVDDEILASFDFLNIMMQMEDAFEIIVPPTELKKENFNSVDSMVRMVERIKG